MNSIINFNNSRENNLYLRKINIYNLELDFIDFEKKYHKENIVEISYNKGY